MQRTALYAAHLQAGGRMVPFAGWEMPVQYAGILQEVQAVRQRWGVFDVSHMARAYFRGADARAFLSRLVPSDLGKVAPMTGQYTVLTNERGGVVDDIILYERAPDEYLMVFNAANRQKDLDWFHRWRGEWGMGVQIDDQTEQTVMLAVQGPEATARLSALLGAPLGEMPRFGATFVEWQGIRLFAARTGYTGEDGFELIAPAQAGVRLWDALLTAGATPCGLGARDVLRTEAGLHLYGHELTDDTNPIEAGLGWLVSDRTDYIGAAAIAQAKQHGVARKLMGVRLTERGVPREGYPVLVDGAPVSTLTSGVYSPTLEQGIGMAYLPTEYAKAGAPCAVEIRGKAIPAVVSTRRFLKGGMTVQAFERTHDTPYPPREERVVSRARWDAFAGRLREHLRLSLGLTPSLPDPPLRALRAEAHRGDGYRIERFALETLPGFYLTGSLFVPDAPADTRAPAMLQPHGHFEGGRLNEADVRRAVALAQAGVYVLSYDMVGYNDQFQLPHGGAEPLEWRRWGFSRAGLQTWNSLCAFEWLRQQRAIDPQRIGCSGISGGGTQTFLLSALEPRLSCAAPVKMVSSVMQGGCICENAPLLRLLAGNPEIAGLTAPRPMLLISDAGDWTRDNPDVVAPYLKRVYGLFRAEEQFAHAHFSEGHQWGAEPRRAYYEWIARVWRLPRTPQDPDLRWESLVPALRVWGDALPKPNDAPTGDAVLRLYQRLVGESVAHWRRTRRFEAEARAALQSMLGLERVEDARDDPLPDAWQGWLPSRRYARLVVALGEASARRWQRDGYTVVRLPELPRPASKTDYAYLATYNLTPDTARARALLGVLLRLKPRATRLAVAAQGAWATLSGIACALAQVPLDAPSLAEPEPLDLPCYDRLGGAATLRQILASPE